MRTWGRAADGSWIEVTTDANGYNDAVYLTTLIQVLKLAPGESPFFANYGVPARASVVSGIFPDFYTNLTQQQFSPYFASLQITRQPNSNPPAYDVAVLTNTGATINGTVAT
jgi:hypothetical protein